MFYLRCVYVCVPFFAGITICPLSFLPARYKTIHKEKSTAVAAGDDKKRSTDLLFKYDKTKKEWQLGKTKVRFRGLWQHLFKHHEAKYRRLEGNNPWFILI